MKASSEAIETLMWADGFRQLAAEPHTLEYALLKTLLPRDMSPHARATALIAVRLLRTESSDKRPFIFMVPAASKIEHDQDLAYAIVSGLLVADCVYRSQDKTLPNGDKGLLSGDLLLVSHVVGKCVDLLRNLRVGPIAVKELWNVDSFSRYNPMTGLKPRVFVANPGWIVSESVDVKFTAAVIDATHPRTLAMLPQLIKVLGSARVAIMITPPLLEYEFNGLHYPDGVSGWLWDPEAQRSISDALAGTPMRDSLPPEEKHIWLCNDEEVDNALASTHDLLAACQNTPHKEFTAFWGAWSVYHRLRQLVVRLELLEQSALDCWGATTLTKRIGWLQEQQPIHPILQAHWPSIVQSLLALYDLLAQRQEPEKFWATVEILEKRREDGGYPVRVVVPAERDIVILSMHFRDIITDWDDLQRNGSVEIITAREEARRIAAGDQKRTILLGYRSGIHKYLDLYPSYCTEVVAYPYEMDIEISQQEQEYDFLEKFENELVRAPLLAKLQFPVRKDGQCHKSPRPALKTAGYAQPRARKVRPVLIEPGTMDLQRLATRGMLELTDLDFSDTQPIDKRPGVDTAKTVSILFDDGRWVAYAPWQGVDVYHTDDKIRRYPADKLKTGLRVVVLVDGVYERLYDRLLDALKAKINAYELIILAQWDEAKRKSLGKARGNRRTLYDTLNGLGLQVEYGALITWFRGDDSENHLGENSEDEFETIAPQQFADYKLLAEYSGLYQSDEMVKVTFKVIQRERQRRRDAGRHLRALLRAIVGGEGYEHALLNARAMSSEIAEVLAAVKVCRIEKIKITKPQDPNSNIEESESGPV